MKVIEMREVEKLVRATFPAKRGFSADAELGLAPGAPAAVAFVHGGPDPFLDRQFDSWLDGAARFVPVYQLLNRLCRAGALPPGDYAVTRRGTA
ncbi:MAG TPA: hypothetical protein VLD36_21360 [Burkholderiales bacterium]|jgi:hypothetical protein|nr:hypothetical protein [Burkholderiales bacterium]